jgi:outer membrane lipoprotein SlyB
LVALVVLHFVAVHKGLPGGGQCGITHFPPRLLTNPNEPQQNGAQQAPPNDNLQMELDDNHDEAPAAPVSPAAEGGLVGAFVGQGVGPFVRETVGAFVGSLLGGSDDGGVDVGRAVRGLVGDNVGADEGSLVGSRLGPLVGKEGGRAVGVLVGVEL